MDNSDRTTTTVALEGSLDSGAVERVRALLQRLPAHEGVVLDFSKVRDVDWFALATLAASPSLGPGCRVSVKGICEQHARLLAYLGIAPGPHFTGGPGDDSPSLPASGTS